MEDLRLLACLFDAGITGCGEWVILPLALAANAAVLFVLWGDVSGAAGVGTSLDDQAP
jgi:hypothetical protein